MAYIEIHDVSKIYISKGKSFLALENIQLSIQKGEFLCLLGPSGCGKSTLLNAIAGFELLTRGEIRIDGKLVTQPSLRRLMIFQDYGLLPWRTVRKNVELGLESLGIAATKRMQIAREKLALVGLEAFAERHPAELSGGQRQRVAIARALAAEPEMLFMDEPFAALDAITRMKLQDEVSAICRQQGRTILFVTHDIDEAIVLADRIVLMSPNPGRIQKIFPVRLGKHRDRTSEDFLHIREKIFVEFQMKPKDQTEYYI